MWSLDVAAFYALNADALTPPVVVASARWISHWLPMLMNAVLVGFLALGTPRQRRVVLLCFAAMLLAWLEVQALRLWLP